MPDTYQDALDLLTAEVARLSAELEHERLEAKRWRLVAHACADHAADLRRERARPEPTLLPGPGETRR